MTTLRSRRAKAPAALTPALSRRAGEGEIRARRLRLAQQIGPSKHLIDDSEIRLFPTSHPWGDGPEVWLYSNQYHYLANFDRRWLFMEGGVVELIANDYWED